MIKAKKMDLEYNIRGILHLFFRQKKKLLIAFFVIFVPGLLMTLRLEPYHETKSSILLKFGQNARPEVILPGSQGAVPINSFDRDEVLQSNVSILTSVDLIKKALINLDVNEIVPDLDDEEGGEDNKLRKVAAFVRGNLRANAGVNNYLIEIKFRHKDAQISADVSKALIEAFKERHTEIYETPQINFLQQQADKAQNQLDYSRETFNAFKKEAGVSEIDQEIAQLLKQKNDLSKIAYQSVTEAQENLSALEAKAAEMRATYRSNSPVMRSMRESIAVARSQLNARQSDMASVDTSSNGTLATQTASIDERITWLEAQRGKFNELEQQVNLDEENLKYYRQRIEEARVNSMLNDQNITRISIIEEPTAPLKPSGPNKKMILVALIMFAGLAAAAIAILYELLDDRFSFPNQIRARLNLPVLTTFTEAEVK